MRFEYGSKITQGVRYNDKNIVGPRYSGQSLSNIEGLVAHYIFRENSGNTLYDSIGGNHGTINGASWTSGINYSGGLSFDGVDDYVDCGAGLTDTDGTWTWEAWIYPTDNTSGIEDFIITEGDDGSSIRTILVWQGDQIQLYCGDSSNNVLRIDATSVGSVNVWKHIAAVRNGDTIELFLDGSSIGTDTNSSVANDTFKLNTLIGSNADSDGWFDGKISDVRIWNITRTQTEIQDNIYGLIY